MHKLTVNDLQIDSSHRLTMQTTFRIGENSQKTRIQSFGRKKLQRLEKSKLSFRQKDNKNNSKT
jgi:hypothetical protein